MVKKVTGIPGRGIMKPVKLNQAAIYPSKIVCIGRNYVDHIKELGNEMPAEPVIFLKPNSAISDVIQSGLESAIHYESEITFMVKSCQLAAVGFGLDLTRRDLQSKLKSKGLPWERSKAFDGAAVFSEFVDCPANISQLRLELFINGKLIQAGGCELMINKPQDILEETRAFLTYEDGDLLMTGTPAGVGALNKGDVFIGTIFDADKLLLKTEWTVQ